METIPGSNTSVARAILFEDLYLRAFPAVARFINARNGSYEDARDIFQDALVVYYEKSLDGMAAIRAPAEAYILGIAKHLWVRKFRHEKKAISFSDVEMSITIPDDLREEVQPATVLKLLEHAGKKCLALLTAFYFEKRPILDIRDQFGYGSDHSATVQKFKCLEKVRDVVNEKSMRYEDFTE